MSDTRRWYQHRRFIARSDRYHNKKLHINKSIRLKFGRENCHYPQYMNVPEKLDLKYFVHPECYKKFVQGRRHWGGVVLVVLLRFTSRNWLGLCELLLVAY